MKFELNSHILIAHWIPGFLLVMALRPTLAASASDLLKSLMAKDVPGGDAMITLALVVAAFIAGEILDASRDLIEHLWDRFQKVEWAFFFEGDKDEVEKLMGSYYTYYVFDCNMSLAIVILLLSHFFTNFLGGGLVVAFMVVVFFIFAGNAKSLRSEISTLTKRWHQSQQQVQQA